MEDPTASRCLDRASVHVHRHEGAEALAWLDRARELGGETGREQLLRGLALSHGQQPEEALQAFRRSTMLDPSAPRGFYNYGCLLARLGQTEQAKEAVDQALALRPDYPAAKKLRTDLDSHAFEAVFDLEEPHTLGWIAEAKESWTWIGWAAVALAAGTWIARFLAPVATHTPSPRSDAFALGTDPLSVALVFLSIVSVVSSFVWVGFDLIDRRGRAIWMVPMVVFTFWGGLIALPHALYMIVGRK
ncbi:MAG TPA: tetratricopeptide repeat protein [Fimbriimonas sp.]